MPAPPDTVNWFPIMSDITTAVPRTRLESVPTGALAWHSALSPKAEAISLPLVGLAAGALDFFGLGLSGLTIRWLYDTGETDIAAQYWVAVPLITSLALVLVSTFGGYRLLNLRSLIGSLPQILIAWSLSVVALLAFVFFLRAGTEFSRVWAIVWWLVGGFTLLATRLFWRARTRAWAKAGRLDRNAVIVGGGESATRLIQALENSKTAGIRIVGLFDDRAQERSAVANYPTLGSFDDLVAFARSSRVDLLILALPLAAEARLMHLLKTLWVLPVDIRVSALSSRLRFRPRAYSYIGDVPFLDVFDKPLSAIDAVLKGIFDRVVGALALILMSPIMLCVAALVKVTSPGPILFRQKRYGFNNEMIEVYKFRSMYVDQSDANAVKLVTKSDPRVTPVGRLIRKTSLDELPQLFNVVFHGNLSLVGPRPHAVHAKAADSLYQDVVDGYYARHKMKPGITGWAQINGWRGETDTSDKIQRRVECDLHYIENWSLFLDAYILFMTPIALVSKSEGAY